MTNNKGEAMKSHSEIAMDLAQRFYNNGWTSAPIDLENAVIEVICTAVQEEREVCSKVAGMYLYDSHPDYHICKGIAQAIRQRSKEK